MNVPIVPLMSGRARIALAAPAELHLHFLANQLRALICEAQFDFQRPYPALDIEFHGRNKRFRQ